MKKKFGQEKEKKWKEFGEFQTRENT